jgi:hypothetical protein
MTAMWIARQALADPWRCLASVEDLDKKHIERIKPALQRPQKPLPFTNATDV